MFSFLKLKALIFIFSFLHTDLASDRRDFIYIIKGNFSFFLRYHLQNHSMYRDEVYWNLICRDVCPTRYKNK